MFRLARVGSAKWYRRMRFVFALWFFLLACCLTAAGVREGMSRLEVEAAIGKPTSVMKMGERLVLSYPKGGRVVLVGDKVVEMISVPVGEAQPVEKPASKNDEDGFSKEEGEPEEAGVSVEKTKPASPAKTDGHLEPEPEISQDEPAEPAAGLLLRLLVGAVIRIGVVMLVLKLAFKWADVHADWGQMFLPALADTVVRSVFDVVGATVLHVTDWFYVDEAVSYFVLLFVLMKTTHACTLVRAVSVAGAAKLMSILVGSLIVVFVLHLLA